jgi:ABC-type bacteriocin/lantibiotic exporter with double-glycine peptidase domain
MSVIDRVPTIDGLSDQGTTPETKPDGQIELRSVDFAYPTRPDILICKDYSLVINPGENIALVGASGCGKVSSNELIQHITGDIK